MRNWKAVKISHELFKEWLTTGSVITVRCDEGLPEDPAFVRSYYDFDRGEVTIIYEHPSFPEVEEGAAIETLNITFTLLNTAELTLITKALERSDGLLYDGK